MKVAFLTLLSVFVYLGGSDSAEPAVVYIKDGLSGKANTTHYWNCCKPACSWRENCDSSVDDPIPACDVGGVDQTDPSDHSICETETPGESYMCTNQQPWAVNDTFAYGFVGASFETDPETKPCCACLLLTFSGDLDGKSMLVQVTNSGGGQTNRFDLSVPGGGIGSVAIGCTSQWNATDHGWGDQWNGVANKAACATLPAPLQPGCRFRFDFLKGDVNPPVSFAQVKCPKAITDITGCVVDS